MRSALMFRLLCLMLAACAVTGCAGGGAPSAEVQAEKYRLVARATFKKAVQDRYDATALSGPSLLYSAGLVYSLDKDADGVVFVNDVCQNLFPNGLRTLALSDVNEVSVVRSHADGALLSNLFGASFAQAKEASVEIALRGVEEQRVPSQSLRASLIDQTCRDLVRARLQTEAAKPKQQRARLFVVMRAVKARDIYFDIAFKSATDASAALAVVSGKYQASILSQIKIRARPIPGFASGPEAWAFGINRVDVSEIVPAPNNQIRLVPVAVRKLPGRTQLSMLR
ncbi:MAG: hypothetical protein ABL901_17070 [Hyphomicrobiaceae bacterium]